MKKNVLALVAATALIAAVWSGVGAFASSSKNQTSASVNSRLRVLEGKVRTLNAQLTVVKKKATRVDNLQKCLRATGLSSYGTPPTTGFYFTLDGGLTSSLTTAVDFDTEADPHVWAASIDNRCVNSSAALGSFQIRKPTATLQGKSR